MKPEEGIFVEDNAWKGKTDMGVYSHVAQGKRGENKGGMVFVHPPKLTGSPNC